MTARGLEVSVRASASGGSPGGAGVIWPAAGKLERINKQNAQTEKLEFTAR
jgi:hypothetical protein